MIQANTLFLFFVIFCLAFAEGLNPRVVEDNIAVGGERLILQLSSSFIPRNHFMSDKSRIWEDKVRKPLFGNHLIF